MIAFKKFLEETYNDEWNKAAREVKHKPIKDRVDALKDAVHMHSRTQRNWVHNNEKNPIKRKLKNLKYYGGYAAHALGGGVAAMVAGVHPHHALAAGAVAVAHPLYTHARQFKNEYKASLRMTRQERIHNQLMKNREK